MLQLDKGTRVGWVHLRHLANAMHPTLEGSGLDPVQFGLWNLFPHNLDLLDSSFGILVGLEGEKLGCGLAVVS